MLPAAILMSDALCSRRLTLPAAILMSGVLSGRLRQLFRATND
jgi:hypothetical protein